MAVRVNVSTAHLQQVGLDTANRLVTDVTRRTLNRSAVLCPVDTGRLRASGTMSVRQLGNQVTGRVDYTADYAMAVHDGTSPHTITPRRGERLRFVVGGQVVYARSVHHPGTPARPFLADALEEVAGGEGFDVTRS